MSRGIYQDLQQGAKKDRQGEAGQPHLTSNMSNIMIAAVFMVGCLRIARRASLGHYLEIVGQQYGKTLRKHRI